MRFWGLFKRRKRRSPEIENMAMHYAMLSTIRAEVYREHITNLLLKCGQENTQISDMFDAMDALVDEQMALTEARKP